MGQIPSPFRTNPSVTWRGGVCLKTVFITLGEPESINIEILAIALREPRPKEIRLVLIGSLSQWKWQTNHFQTFSKDLPWEVFPNLERCLETNHQYNFVDLDGQFGLQAKDGIPSAEICGQLSRGALLELEKLDPSCLTHQAVLTMPIRKDRTFSAEFPFHGQTEFFTKLAGKPGIMLLSGPKLRVGLASNHLPLRHILDALSIQIICEKIILLHETLKSVLHISAPRLGIAAINPHAGDGGLYGNEDRTIVEPAIASALRLLPGAKIAGPIPADTLFHRALSGQYDGVLAMYHDQGLGPLKTVHFHDAINITGGLPFLRVSPDHGPAQDLFLQGKASTQSTCQAMQLAVQYLLQ